MVGYLSLLENQPSTSRTQLHHLAKFGAPRKARPTDGELLIWVCALWLTLLPLQVVQLTPTSLSPLDYIPRNVRSSSGFDGALQAASTGLLTDPMSAYGTLSSDRAHPGPRPKTDEVLLGLKETATAAFWRVIAGGHLSLSPCLSAGRSALRNLRGGVRSGGRLVWNLSKVVNLLLGPLLDALKHPYHNRRHAHSLYGYVAQHRGHSRLAAEFSGCCLFISADLPRYDSSFPTWVLSFLCFGILIVTGSLSLVEITHLLFFLMRSLLICLVILPTGSAYYKTEGLSSGHIAVSFMETLGTELITKVWLLRCLLWHGQLSLWDAINYISRQKYGTFRCLGDDLLIGLSREFAQLAFASLSGEVVGLHHSGINWRTSFRLLLFRNQHT